VAATGLRENTDQPGGVQMPADVFKGVQLAMIESMVFNGFKDIYVMGDHGGGQQQIKEAVEEMEKKDSASKGVHIYYIADFYQKTHDDVDMLHLRAQAADRRPRRDDGNLRDALRGTGDRDVRAADLQDDPVRSDGPDTRAVEGGA
jgi:hypothetical protein